ncbi:MAG: DNA repair protein RadA, partial [Bacteroidales bacterium]|nr:DNA repair protein RadA [Bacteroidales bacterium]
MAKARKIYVCTNCGADSSKWIGRCPSCGQWNTYKEEIIAKPGGRNEILPNSITVNKPKLLSEIDIINHPRIVSGITEFDRILGGGIIPGSLILLGGEPGIGKSTIALQIALQQKQKVLYNSGEESQQQIKLRAERLKHSNEQCYILNEQNLEKIILSAKELKPDLIVIDSVQTLFTSHIEATTGTISQIRECTHQLMNYAKAINIPVIIIGHITKDGTLAGPKILEHMVDVVLLFEGDSHLNYRIIRSIKNRFGAVPELAVFEMKHSGLSEIKNPSLLFFDFE